MNRPLRSIVTCLAAAALIGCGTSKPDLDGSVEPDAGPDSGPDGGNPADGGPDGGNGLSIYDVRGNTVAVGAPVELEGVIVTAVDTYGVYQGQVFVQDPQGGAFSALVVAPGATGAAGLVPGDVVNITGGVKEEYAFGGDASGRTQTRIVAPASGTVTITKTGTASVPAPAVVDPGLLTASAAEAEKWESVLVRLAGVGVMTAPVAPGADPTNAFAVVGGPFQIRAGLTPLEVDGAALAVGDCLERIDGVLEYFVEYQLLPRAASDLAAGTGCPVGTSIVSIQNATVPTGTDVQLRSVVVTALSGTDAEARVWVADAAAAAPYNGILVFQPTILGGGTLSVGQIVHVSGRVTEYFDLTELWRHDESHPARIVPTSGTALPTPVTVPLATLAAPGTAEPYEGVLVRLELVTVTSTNPDDPQDFGAYVVSVPGPSSIRVNPLIHATRAGRAVSECLNVLTGIVNYGFGAFSINPRSDEDVVSGFCL